MKHRQFFTPNRAIRGLAAAFLTLVVMSGSASAYTPEDPTVQRLVKGGIKFLESFNDSKSMKDGEAILLAYTHFKVEHDPDNPIIARGLKAANHIYSEAAKGADLHEGNYEVPLIILLYAAIDPVEYRPQLEVLQRYLFSIQKPHGGFSYPQTKEGDVSQTQYVMLAIWTLDRLGIQLDYQKVSATILWILRVQDPGGCWPYKGVDPGPGKPLQPQKRLTHSMALAGGSTVLIAGDALRLWGDTNVNDPGIPGLPKAIKIYKEDANSDRRKRVKISKEAIFRAVERQDNFRQKTPYTRTPKDFYYYQMYTLERYQSFLEIARGKPADKSPGWYNKGVDDLKKYADAEGGWRDATYLAPRIKTCFAILFLIRSTKKSIVTSSDGATRGGRGFQDDVSKAKLVNGKSETKAPAVAVTGLLDLLEKDGADELADQALPENLTLAKEPKARAAEFDRLERLVRGSSSWQARRVAARVLGKSDDMRVVPSLIFALSDGDTKVRRYARDGLRFISRKFEGYGMPDKPNNIELRDAQRKWQAWYLTMNPSYIFLDEQ